MKVRLKYSSIDELPPTTLSALCDISRLKAIGFDGHFASIGTEFIVYGIFGLSSPRLPLDDNLPDHPSRRASIRKVERAGPTIPRRLVRLDLQASDPVDYFSILHGDELMTVGVPDVERVVVVHRESGSH